MKIDTTPRKRKRITINGHIYNKWGAKNGVIEFRCAKYKKLRFGFSFTLDNVITRINMNQFNIIFSDVPQE